MATSREKLAAFVSPNAAASDFKLPPIPKLYDAMAENGFKQGPRVYDEQMAEWARQLERSLNERLSGKAAVSPGNG